MNWYAYALVRKKRHVKKNEKREEKKKEYIKNFMISSSHLLSLGVCIFPIFFGWYTRIQSTFTQDYVDRNDANKPSQSGSSLNASK